MILSSAEIRVIKESDADFNLMIGFMKLVKACYPDSRLLEITNSEREDFPDTSVAGFRKQMDAVDNANYAYVSKGGAPLKKKSAKTRQASLGLALKDDGLKER